MNILEGSQSENEEKLDSQTKNVAKYISDCEEKNHEFYEEIFMLTQNMKFQNLKVQILMSDNFEDIKIPSTFYPT